MIEIRIHGRGGQGGKKAAQIIARAAYLSGYKTQDFAMYGAERKGAPVTSFVRFDKDEIRTRGYVFEPDYILILDETIDVNKCLSGRKDSTQIIINSKNKYKNIKNAYVIDATGIALKNVGCTISNIAIVGAWIKLFKKISFDKFEAAVKKEFEGKLKKDILNNNIKAAKECYNGIN